VIDLGWLDSIEFASFFFNLTARIDFGWFGYIESSPEFYSGLFAILVIDLVLAGDNAVIIALAVNKLPKKQRTFGIIFGSGLAIVLRTILTFVAARLLEIPFLKLVGGILILWIAVKLFKEGHEKKGEEAGGFWAALKTIIIADVVMSLDNVLAVAGAAKGNNFLIVFGLIASIPLIIAGSALLSEQMRKYPVIITIGAAILGWVGGDMVISDPWIVKTFDPNVYADYAFKIFFTVGIVIVGKFLLKKQTETSAAG